MSHRQPASGSRPPEHRAVDLIASAFQGAGWNVARERPAASGRRPDLVASKAGERYAIEVKVAPEGRGDRLIPLWSQACLQAAQSAHASSIPARKLRPLAVVAAPRIAPRVVDQLLRFAAEFAPHAAVGLVDYSGLRVFRGRHLEGLDAEASHAPALHYPAPGENANLFSDANQWMLKVLLAPELPERLLSAPRGRYCNASQLARAAGVSVMSASRCVRQLRLNGFIEVQSGYMQLVRRPQLFARWQESLRASPVDEIAVRFALRGSVQRELDRIMSGSDAESACLGLFAAADALQLGFVRGAIPYLYVADGYRILVAERKQVIRAKPGDQPELILRRAAAPRSVFNGSVQVGKQRSCDVIQVWLDVASHPARGREQADLIEKRVLGALMHAAPERGHE